MSDSKTFTENDISDILGDKFRLRTQANGNIQAQIENLGNYSDLDKCEMLVKASRAIFDSGLIAETPETRAQIVRLSWPTGRQDPQTSKEIWIPFPQLWLNKPSETVVRSQANTQAVTDLESKVNALQSMMVQMVNAISANAGVANVVEEKPAPKAKASKQKRASSKKSASAPEPAPVEDIPGLVDEGEQSNPF